MTEAKHGKPNVLLFAVHDFGRYAGAYGREMQTPRLDALAEEGALFENHFCSTPSCAPSRASMQTGLMPHNHGMLGHPNRPGKPRKQRFGWEIEPGIETLPQRLRGAGYETHLCCYQHASPTPERIDYDYLHALDDDAYWAPEVAPVAQNLLQSGLDDDPWYVEVGFGNTHRPFDRGEKGPTQSPPPGYHPIDPADVDVPGHLPDRPAVREDFAEFHAAAYELDYYVGEILDTLAETGQAEETLVVFVADHGIPHPRAKGACYDAGTEAALMMRLPGRVDGGTQYDELLGNVDLLPTILDFAGGDIPDGIDGRSFRPLIDEVDDRPYRERDAVYVERTWFVRYNPIRAIRTERFKYIRNCWTPMSHVTFGAHHLDLPEEELLDTERIRPEAELYDLEADPDEMDNLATDEKHRSIREELDQRLHDRLAADGDQLLDGPVGPVRANFDWKP